MTIEGTRGDCNAVVDAVEKVIVGKRDVLELVLLGIVAGGHVLLEDVPGLAKTLMARSFAQVLGLRFKRVQFTPDLLPADITGSYLYDQRRGEFEFRKGPVFTDLLLGDEINRAPPKTQAALLEAMQEGQVTVEEETFSLGRPFVVIATQNPIEHEGTYPLPEAQLDRFILRSSVGYPARDQEAEMLQLRLDRRRDEVELEPVVDAPRLLEMQATLESVHVDRSITSYIVELVRATRSDNDIHVGASPRGALAIMKLARGKALLAGRDFVTPEDVKAVAVPALAHRLVLRPELWVRKVTGEDVVAGVLQRVPTPPVHEEPAPHEAPTR
ncbi:MAG TPA: MoxR family ATPase [Actinomycetota bacterium]|nr:MoxR family ATPase [Actinomycetota bacterium]